MYAGVHVMIDLKKGQTVVDVGAEVLIDEVCKQPSVMLGNRAGGAR